MPDENDVLEFAKALFEKETGRSWGKDTFSERGSDTPVSAATDGEKERYIRQARVEMSKLQEQKK